MGPRGGVPGGLACSAPLVPRQSVCAERKKEQNLGAPTAAPYLRGSTSVQATPSGIPSLPGREVRDGVWDEGVVCRKGQVSAPSCHVSGSFLGGLAGAVLAHRMPMLLPQLPYKPTGLPQVLPHRVR